jgi:hypothetical protein
MAKNEKTSEAIGSLAGRTLRDPEASLDEKRLAGSALTQRPDRPKWFAYAIRKDPDFLRCCLSGSSE